MKAHLLIITTLLFAIACRAATPGGGDGNPDLKSPEAALQRWCSFRVGAFIHWGPEAVHGPRTPLKDFKGENFDPAQWVRLFKDAGFKYVVFTTKHGNAVCMWDTKTTTRNVMNTSMKRDVVGELVAECRKQGVAFCPYYAIENFLHPDWTNFVDPKTGAPDFSRKISTAWSAGGPDSAAYHLTAGQKPDFERYVSHLKAQMKELTEKYGPFPAWWFDQCAQSWTHARGTDLYAYMRSLQPDVLLNNRVDTSLDHGLDNRTMFVTQGKSAGDYTVSEVALPRFNRDIPWEYCNLAGTKGETWFWQPGNTCRPLNDWILDIVSSACRDGNFLLGISPKPDGTFEPEFTAQFRQLGRWLAQNGESIYGTRGGPFQPNLYYGSTCKGNNVYVHVLKTQSAGIITLPPIKPKVLRAYLMTGATLSISQTDEAITLNIGKTDAHSPDTIAVLELDASAEQLPAVEERPVNAGVVVTASNVRGGKKEFAPEQTIDGNAATYWTTDEGVNEAWLEYDLGKPRTFRRAVLDEGDDGWIRHVQIQIKTGDKWKTVFEYRHGNPELWKAIPMAFFCPEFRFPPVTAQIVRVKMESVMHGPVVREFKLYAR